jgi:hypothetical protein
VNEDIERRFREVVQELGLTKVAEAILPSSLSFMDDRVQEQVETSQGDATTKSSLRPEPAPTKITTINIFQHPDSHPYVLDLLLLRKYGPDWMEWEPETLRAYILHDFPTTSVSDLALSKLNAMKTLHYVGTFWTNWEVFLACTMPLNGLFPDFVHMQIPNTAQCAVAVETAGRVRDDVKWSDELRSYLATACKFDGIFCPPEPLDFVEVGAEEHDVDVAAIRKLWPDVRRTGVVPREDSVVAEQLRRMLVVRQVLNENREHLRQQLTALLHV